MRTLVLALLLAPVLSAQTPGDVLESELGFRLASPGPGWRLLDEEQAREIQPRAVAGLLDPNGLYNVVVMESVPEEDLTDLARQWADNSGLENAELDLFEELRFEERPAVRWMVTGTSEGTAWTHHFVIFTHERSLFRLVSWARAELVEPDGSSFQPFLDAFSLTQVEAGRKLEGVPAPEAQGAGWLLADGVWQSSAYGLEARIEAPWCAIHGDELRELDPDAAIGLVDGEIGARMLLAFERVDPPFRSTWAKEALSSAAAEGTERKEAILVDFSGVEQELRMYEPRSGGDGGSIGMRMLFGTTVREGFCIRIRVDYPAARENAALERVRTAFEGMRFLEQEEKLGVMARLKATYREPNLVGDGYSLRSGVYRDFRFGLTWKRPSIEWEVETGEQAFERMPNAVLTIHHPYWDVRGAVIPVPVQSLPPGEWHDKVLDDMYGDARYELVGEERTITVGDREARYSASRPAVGFAPTQYRLVTTANDSWAFQIHFWGAPEILERAQEDLDAVLAGFSIAASPSPASFNSGGALYDDRLGFQLLSPGTDWLLDDEGAENFWPAGTLVRWTHGEDECVGVVAVCGVPRDEEDHFFASLARYGLPQSFAEWLRRDPEVSEVYLCGHPVRELSWRHLDRRATCWTVFRDETLYLVFATDAAGEFDRTRICDLFTLIP